MIRPQLWRQILSSLSLCAALAPLQAAPDSEPPGVVSFDPPPGDVLELSLLTVTFSEPVLGVEAADLTINGVEAQSVAGSGDRYTFTFVPAPDGQATVTWSQDHGITDTAVPPNPFDATGPEEVRIYQVADDRPPTIASTIPGAELTLRSLGEVSVTFTEPVVGVEAADLLANGIAAGAVTGEDAGPYVFSFEGAGPGLLSIAWADGHGITDLAPNPNPFVATGWSYTIDPNGALGDLAINEFAAANRSGRLDEDEETSDWIELWNFGDTTVELAGWSLSDDPDDPGKFVLPARTIAPGAFLVIAASGKDRAPAGPGEIHTNFKLAASGEPLGLYPPELPRTAADQLLPEFPPQRNDHSYGRDSLGAWRYYDSPTPGAPNGNSQIVGLLDPPHLNAERGFYSQPFELHLSSSTPGISIRYTTDGSEPTIRNGQLYRRPLRISGTTVLRAAAFGSGYLPSEIVTHTYLYNVSAAILSLPVVSLVTDDSNLWGPTGIQETNPRNTTKRGLAWERPVSAELIKPGDNSGLQVNCGLRVQGGGYVRGRYEPNGGLPFSKYSFRLYFRGDYGPTTLKYAWFEGSEVQEFDRITLRAGMNDHSNPFIVDELVRRMQIASDNIGARGNFVNLFINGQYKGYYNPTERIDDDFMRSWHGGENDWDVIAQFGEVREGDTTAWNRMRSFVSRDLRDPANYLSALDVLDVDNFIDYLLTNTYAGTGDWPHNNWRAARERIRGRAAKFRFYVWDAEWAFGNQGRSVSGNTLTSELGGGSEIAQIYQSLLRSTEFRLRWADRVHKHFYDGGAYEDEKIAAHYEEMRSELARVLPGMSTTIPNLWIPNRRRNIMLHMTQADLHRSDAAPLFTQHGGNIAPGFELGIRARGGPTVYYTLDGSDPRVPLARPVTDLELVGTVSETATEYTGLVTLSQTTVVKARSLDRGVWSALTEAEFFTGPAVPAIRITEIMYNPAEGRAFEFIELHNAGSRTVDLGRMQFSGISFAFPPDTLLPPGERLVLSSNDDPGAFAARYPGVTVFGTFGGSLSNDGERLALRDGLGRTILSIDYRDDHGWPAAADGEGKSLVLIDFDADPDDPANWTASALDGGSPGTANPAPPEPPVIINEVLAHNQGAVANGGTFPAMIELRNPGPEPQNLAGWGLSNDGAVPRKFTFGADARIDGNGHLVIWCDHDLGAPGLHSGFELDPRGGSLFLTNLAGERLDAFSFGLQVADLSVSRTATEWQLTPPTPGALNTAAVALAPQDQLALNEWLANRIAGQGDWLELYNRDPVRPVALRNLHLGNGESTFRYGALSFLAPRSFVRLWADEGTGPQHLDFRLPAKGSTLTLTNSSGVLFDSLVYSAQAEDTSRGRLPDGTGAIRNFPDASSPGAPNYLSSNPGLRFNELLARNASSQPGWVELRNDSGVPFPLDGFALAIDHRDGPLWLFPDGLTLPLDGHLSIACDGSRPASSAPDDLNTGISLSPRGGSVYLFDPAGREIDRLSFGSQVAGLSIGRRSDTGPWTLLSSATPEAPNSISAPLGSVSTLQINEWLANASTGQADFVELFNPADQTIELSGLRLTDDLSTNGVNQFVFPPLSYLGAGAFLALTADNSAAPGHLPFGLNASGESLRLYRPTGTLVIDEITWENEAEGVSSGRLPDGGSTISQLPFASPGGSNTSDPLADRDGDGIPDHWEDARGLNPDDPSDALHDHDLDQRNNLFEYISNTDPHDRTSFLTIESMGLDLTGFTIGFTARPGVAYTVQFSDDLANWQVLLELAAAPSERPVTAHDPAAISTRLYRLVAER